MITSDRRMQLNAAQQRSRAAYQRVMADNGLLRCPVCSDADKDVYHPKNFCTTTLKPVIEMLKRAAS